MQILAFECSAVAASVALMRDEKLIGEKFLNVKQTHSVTLLPMAEQLLKETGVSVGDVDYLAVAAGPGSFTGLRIGIAAVKGMAFYQNKLCIPVSTLEAMAYNRLGKEETTVCVMDARCQQVYNAIFIQNGNNEIERYCEDRAISLEELQKELKNIPGRKILVGDGAQLCYNFMMESVEDLELAEQETRDQRAAGVARLAFRNISKAVPCETLTPIYLRLPQAERELLEKQKGKSNP